MTRLLRGLGPLLDGSGSQVEFIVSHDLQGHSERSVGDSNDVVGVAIEPSQPIRGDGARMNDGQVSNRPHPWTMSVATQDEIHVAGGQGPEEITGVRDDVLLHARIWHRQ